MTAAGKVAWSGILTSVQPRIRLTRSYDERTHSYLGYVLRVRGRIGEEEREFLVAVGEAAHGKHAFRAGDEVRGEGAPVADPRTETTELYKVSGFKVLARRGPSTEAPPPWLGLAPALTVYRERGHRRLPAIDLQGSRFQPVEEVHVPRPRSFAPRDHGDVS